METTQARRVTGLCGVLIGLGATLSVPLYFMYSGPPPAWNVLSRDLVNLVVLALFIVFVAGFSHVLRRADPVNEWVASVVYGAGMLSVGVSLIAVAHEAGVVFGAPDGTLDPTTDGPLAEANILIHGSIKRMLTAVMLFAAGYAMLRSDAFPRWVGWFAHLVALINLAFVPSLFFGRDVTKFYSAHGWGNSALTGCLIGYWMLAVGIVLLRKRRSERVAATQDAPLNGTHSAR
jgi:cbb3-type cytochrome oxidase subunit 3